MSVPDRWEIVWRWKFEDYVAEGYGGGLEVEDLPAGWRTANLGKARDGWTSRLVNQ